MADPVLRIPVDDEAFKRYLALFAQYQEKLQAQPGMWETANEAILEGVSANLALADAIGESVAAAIRLGDAQDQNARARKRDAQDKDSEKQRASSWRRKALDHVKELSRSTAGVVRELGAFASGNGGAASLFGGISSIGKGIGGPIGNLINLAGTALSAGYAINSSVSDRGQFARGIGTTIGQQEGFQNSTVGRYTNTDQGIDAVMNARGSPGQFASFAKLGITDFRGNKSNAEVYGEVLRQQVALAKRHMDANGNIRFWETDPRGGADFGTSHEDLNRLVRAPNLNQAIDEAVKNKSVLDKQIDAATKSAAAADKVAQRMIDNVAALGVNSSALNKVTDALDKVADITGKVYNLLSFQWFGKTNNAPGSAGHGADAQFAKDHPWLAAMGIHWGTDKPAAGDPNYSNAGIGGSLADRNNNPGNLMVGGKYRHFATMRAGFGAMSEQLVRDFNRGQRSVRSIIDDPTHGWANEWAPGNTHSGTMNYMAYVSKALGIDMDTQLNLHDPAQLQKMMLAMYEFESGHKAGGSTHRSNGGHRSSTVRAANVGVKISVTTPTGHQTAITTNSSAGGV